MAINAQPFTIGEHSYQARKLSIFDQMIVAKRLMPVLKNIITPDVLDEIATMPVVSPDSEQQAVPRGGMATLFPAVADAIYALKDEDLKMLMLKCLGVVERKNDSGVFSPLTTTGGALMFDDVELPDLLKIMWKVVELHLGSFFSTAR